MTVLGLSSQINFFLTQTMCPFCASRLLGTYFEYGPLILRAPLRGKGS